MYPTAPPGKRHAPGGWWDSNSTSTAKSSPNKSASWRDGYREKESHAPRDISKSWEKPRFEYPSQQKWNSHAWKRQIGSGDASAGSGSASVGGGGSVGGYYGPNTTNDNVSITSDNYASLAQPPTTARDYSKFSPGPRFEPPPGKDREFSRMDKSLSNVEENKSIPQLAKSPPSSKVRSDESLAIAKHSFHNSRSIFSKISEVEEGQIGFNPEKETDHENDRNGYTLSSQGRAIEKSGPLSQNHKSNTDMDIDQAPPSSATNEVSNDIPKLTCAMIGDNNTALKAIDAIKIMARVMENEALVPDSLTSAENVPLPEAELVTKAVQEMQKKVKQGQQQLKLIKFKFKRAIFEDAQKKKQHEEKQEEEEQVTDMPVVDSQELNSEEDDGEKRNNERGIVKKRIFDEISESNLSITESEKMISDKIKVVEASNAILVEKEIMRKYDTIIGNAQKKSQEARATVATLSDALSSLESKLQIAENELKDAPIKISEISRLAPSITSDKVDNLPEDISSSLLNVLGETLDVPQDMRNLVKTIIRDNRKTAIQAQNESVSFVAPEVPFSDNELSSPPCLVPELPIKDEQSFVEYVAYWTKRTQSVTGPGDALYSEPSQAPLYQFIEQQHELSHVAIKEHIRKNKIKLYHRWTELSQEYAIREQLYQKASKRDSNGIHSMGLGASYSICGQRRGGGADDNIIFVPADDGNSRATNNPYRRPRRNAGLQVAGGDIVRSDYEQEQIIQQLTAQENMERRIKLGSSDVPRQMCSVEKVSRTSVVINIFHLKYFSIMIVVLQELRACYKDSMLSRRVDDLLEDQIAYDGINPWSDMEKCIFFDRFLQHPKDFRKIASFFRNKSTHDCIAFYYNSKQSVPFKAALKEHQLRKKKRGDTVSWEATIQAAISLGANVTAGYDAEKPLLFHLPPNDLTYTTHLLHPIKLELFDFNIRESSRDESSKSAIRKRRSGIATTFYLDPIERKYLCGDSSSTWKRSSSSSDLDSLSSNKISRPSSEANIQEIKVAKEEKPESSVRRGVSKWKKKEKSLFFELLEKYGKNWQAIADAIETKTATQARNFYYDNKRQNAKNKAAGKVKSVNSKEVGSEAPTQSRSKGLSKAVDEQSITSSQLKYQSGAYPIASEPEHSINFSNRMPSIEQTSSMSLQNQPIGWNGVNPHQHQPFSLSLEQHRLHQQHLSEQQRMLELQLAQQHLMEQQRHFQHQQRFLGILSHQQNNVADNVPNWFAADVLQKHVEPSSSIRNFVDGNEQVSLAVTMRQLHNQNQMNPASMKTDGGGVTSFPLAPENKES
jgi:hypothetical protein